ncbi:MAG: ATP-grasp domain-containing protein [Verrucomicrobia bacterium]|nr:ATP-grasp domain-containing protein [Verrucomicrobiota bacterium]
MRPAVLIVGAGIMQEPAIRVAKSLGYAVIATDIVPTAPGLRWVDYSGMVSKFDVEGHVAFARSCGDRFNLRGVLTIGTDASCAVAGVAAALGLPGVRPETAFMATNKAAMRRRLKECGVPCPEFYEVSGLDEALVAADELGYPIVIKPVDNMGARGVRRIDTPDVLREFFPVSIGNSRSGGVIIEEYMDGPEVSIDTVVENGSVHLLTIADRHIARAPYFVEVGHTIPSVLAPEMLDDVFDVMQAGIRALGITIGASKGDIRVTKHGAKIGEMTARMSGGFHCQYTDPLATGMNSIKAAIDLAVGNRLDRADITPRWQRAAVERAIQAAPGVVTGIEGLDEAREIPGVEHLFLNVAEGSVIEPLTSNMGKPGHVIASGDTRAEAIAAAEQALGTIRIVTVPQTQAVTVHV